MRSAANGYTRTAGTATHQQGNRTCYMRPSPTQLLPWTALMAATLVLGSLLQAVATHVPVVPTHAAAPPGWPASGCLVEHAVLKDRSVVGQAEICTANDESIRASLDVEHLDPWTRHVAWFAYFKSPTLCGSHAIGAQADVQNGRCALADLDDPTPRGLVRSIGWTTADAEGVLHINAPVAINLVPQSQVWLMLGQPSWSPVPHPAYRLIEDDVSQLIASAVFDVP